MLLTVNGRRPGMVLNIKAQKSSYTGTSLVVQWLRLGASHVGALSSVPDRGTRSHMPQLRVHMPQLRPGTANK